MSIQIARKINRSNKIVKTIGVAKTKREEELLILLAKTEVEQLQGMGRDPAYTYLYIRASEHIRPFSEPKRKVSGMTRNAVQSIFAVPDTATRIGLRDLVLMMLSYGVAARIDEILSLKVSDIHLEAKDPFVILHGKGRRIRSIYLQKRLVEWLER